MTKAQRPTAIDLFSGCGGLSLGLKTAGFSVLAAVEISTVATETYKRNHPQVRVWPEDIRHLSALKIAETLGLRPGELDLLAGCPPCQGFSAIRTLNADRASMDKRNDLIYDFLRFVRQLRPKNVMMENVPGLAKDVRFEAFTTSLIRLGYNCTFSILNAADYGVPQRRKRLILLASKARTPKLPVPESKHHTVRAAIGWLSKSGDSGDPLHDMPENRTSKVKRLIRQIPRDGGSRAALRSSMILPCHTRCEGFRDVYGRMAWEEVAPTITSGCNNPSKGRFLHPTEHRAITLREAAILQSFPMSYKFPTKFGKGKIAEMIGNALPPLFIKKIAQEFIRG